MLLAFSSTLVLTDLPASQKAVSFKYPPSPRMKMQQVATQPHTAVMNGSQVRAPNRDRMRLEGTWNNT